MARCIAYPEQRQGNVAAVQRARVDFYPDDSDRKVPDRERGGKILEIKAALSGH